MNLLSEYRKKAALTQAEFASQCGWSQSRIGHYEAGRRSPSLEDAHVIVAKLQEKGVECSIEDVFPPVSVSSAA